MSRMPIHLRQLISSQLLACEEYVDDENMKRRKKVEEDAAIKNYNGTKKTVLLVVVSMTAEGKPSAVTVAPAQTEGVHHPNRLKRWRNLNEVSDRNIKANNATEYSYVVSWIGVE